MRKVLTIFVAITIILGVFTQLLLPGIATGTVESRLKKLLDTESVQAHVTSTPAVMMALGYIGSMDVQAERGRLGKVRTQLLHLTGRSVSLDPAMLAGGHLVIKDAEELRLEGVVSEANLQEYLEKNVKKLKNVEVKMTRDGVKAKAQIMIMGKNADVELEGAFVADDECIYLRTRRLEVRNSRLGKHLSLNLLEEFPIVDFNKINLPLSLEGVVHEDGRAIVRAVYRQ